MAKSKEEARLKRKLSIKAKVRGTAERPRLSVFRSARHIYAQVVDDQARKTLVQVSTLSAEFRQMAAAPATEAPAGEAKGDGEGAKAHQGRKVSDARRIGRLVAAKCKEQNVMQVVFDRNGYIYHGRVAAVADGAREGGLKF